MSSENIRFEGILGVTSIAWLPNAGWKKIAAKFNEVGILPQDMWEVDLLWCVERGAVAGQGL
jgi:hypothetical protein